MSYSIFYRSMFVKLSDGRFIPMMEIGDSNVWDCNYGKGRNKRSRSWCNLVLNRNQKFFSEDEVKNLLEEWNKDFEKKRQLDLQSDEDWVRNSAENGSFGFYEAISVDSKGGTHKTEFKDFRNIVLSGIANYISVDEAIKKCGLKIVYWKKEKGDTALTCQKYERFSTEEEMFNIINEKLDGGEESYYFAYNDGHCTNKCYDTKKAINYFSKIRKKCENGFIVICHKRNEDKKYYLKLCSKSFILTENMVDATRFNKEKCGKVYLSDIIFDELKDVNKIELLH